MIHFNANGKAILTKLDRAAIAAGRDPGDDGSGRRFHVVDETRLVMIVPTEQHPIELGWFAEGAQSDVDVDIEVGDLRDAPDSELGELREQLDEAHATIDRLMAQRDAALGRLADREAHADTLGTPIPAEDP